MAGKDHPPFSSPWEIQRFLSAIPYNSKEECKSPKRVLAERNAHCFEGALFAASRLRELGYPPLLMDLRAWNDDDHVIALFKERGRWGAVAKSNFTTLRFREPVYRTLRELAMSYFDFYFNTLGQKTLRAYSRPLKLSRFDEKNWTETEDDLDEAGEDRGGEEELDAVVLHQRHDDQRHGAGGGGDHPRPAAGEGDDDGDRERGVEPDLGVDTGDDRERDRLGDERERDDEPAEHLGAQAGGGGEGVAEGRDDAGGRRFRDGMRHETYRNGRVGGEQLDKGNAWT